MTSNSILALLVLQNPRSRIVSTHHQTSCTKMCATNKGIRPQTNEWLQSAVRFHSVSFVFVSLPGERQDVLVP